MKKVLSLLTAGSLLLASCGSSNNGYVSTRWVVQPNKSNYLLSPAFNGKAFESHPDYYMMMQVHTVTKKYEQFSFLLVNKSPKWMKVDPLQFTMRRSALPGVDSSLVRSPLTSSAVFEMNKRSKGGGGDVLLFLLSLGALYLIIDGAGDPNTQAGFGEVPAPVSRGSFEQQLNPIMLGPSDTLRASIFFTADELYQYREIDFAPGGMPASTFQFQRVQ
ncbi:hypothetical protein [Phaeocystidibacter luteus]|uniref:Lipoprotein n=1 Tax=Phaeocystidibacter luteus TaxID=911197 RepID=A0A6N6RJM7_9FLAO|nr:hypothetical protein [Phaeocystidibacter luteus]KAB2813953.1 hypothetical protein F8C67_04520 [Phaeocystidibacter luteus]